jgi:hypothetical protein
MSRLGKNFSSSTNLEKLCIMVRWRNWVSIIDSNVLLSYTNIVDTIPLVMSNTVPPPQTWWDDNCYFVNGFIVLDSPLDPSFAFCGYNTKYDTHGPLIQLTFDFVVKYLGAKFWYTSEETGITFWNSMKTVTKRIRNACEKSHDDGGGDLQHFSGSLTTSSSD